MGYLIKRKEILNSTVTKMSIYAPDIAKACKPGQFIILRVDEKGERIPLTIAGVQDLELVDIIFQIVGLTTSKLNQLNVGDEILDFVGPLGKATELDNLNKVLLVGGGVGGAICYPICKELFTSGKLVDVIMGFRNKDAIMLEEEFKAISNTFNLYTDDGSAGTKGFVTEGVKKLINNNYDAVICIGPLMMMKNVSMITKESNVKTIVSMNPLMIDGTGMCGCCRLYVDGKLKFACVDGPDFDGHKVNFDEIVARNSIYKDEELNSYKRRDQNCNLLKGNK